MDLRSRAVLVVGKLGCSTPRAWVEWLQATGSGADRILTGAFDQDDLVTTTGVVVQEVVQGCRDERHARNVKRLFATCEAVDPVCPETYEHAAALYRRCRGAGRSVRGTVDCLVAAIAIEHGLAVLASDRAFSTLRNVCGLRLVRSGR